MLCQDWSAVTGSLTKEDRIWYTIFSGTFQYLIPLGVYSPGSVRVLIP